MKFEKIHNKGQARLFTNKYLEFFTKTHPLVIWAIYIPIIGTMLYYSVSYSKLRLLYTLFTFTAGIISWTFFEYLVHRFAFHFIPESRWAHRIVYIIHGNHHEYPRDTKRLFMPPVPGVIIASLIFGLIYLIAALLDVAQLAFAFFPGFMSGYLIYGTMHYAIHAWSPPFKWMKPLWRNHHLHHYKDGEKGFGVSTTLWDRVFRTMYRSGNSKIKKARILRMRY